MRLFDSSNFDLEHIVYRHALCNVICNLLCICEKIVTINESIKKTIEEDILGLESEPTNSILGEAPMQGHRCIRYEGQSTGRTSL